MKKIFLAIILLLLPLNFVLAQNVSEEASSDNSSDEIFKAQVIEITREEENTLPDGTKAQQQNLKLKGLEGDHKDKEFEYEGISNYDVVKKNLYEVGDKVLVLESYDGAGNVFYYITDYIRTGSIYILLIVFALVLIIIGRWKGFRSLVSLAISFLVLIKYIIPGIINGSNPVTITIIGSFIILLAIIYITEGLNATSHLAVFSIFLSLLITVFLSNFFINLAKLSGLVGEDVFSLVNIGTATIDFRGLLLAGIIIGALGVLDDVVVSQIATVEEIYKANNNFSGQELFKRAYSVGVSHISSMTNTLFLAYAGASLSLLIIFISGQSAFSSWSQIVNNEQIATEIVRTLAGSIGLILSVPIATYVASIWYSNRRNLEIQESENLKNQKR